MTAPTFDHTTTRHTGKHAHCMALAAQLAYKDEDEVHRQTGEWGFDEARFFRVEHEQQLPLDDTQAYVAASEDMVVLAFRGTEPAEIRDWLSDANAPMVPDESGTGNVHMGFHQALDAVFPRVLDALAELHTDEKSLWVTGHSLGGALAMLAAARLCFDEPGILADGLYTFGQPRTCDAALADAFDEEFQGRSFRFVNNNDIVPQVPPDPPYRHVAEQRYIDSRGRVREEETSLLGGVTDSVRGHTADPLSPGADALRDHPMARYVSALENDAA
ncbi:triacylglycerol lipase [Haloactinospora alba]|uniref:Triacylglycerol lipase n=1 Tax=Haloactinospora alba TaxID=405555 RepID=A0A543NNY7_9ACTN|nr:lipase family protein [Haloactinospora alba]TQN33560.1 triacylglycerol lipase [Haloactinospora alba]